MVFRGAFAVVGKFRLGSKCYLVMEERSSSISGISSAGRTSNWRQHAFF